PTPFGTRRGVRAAALHHGRPERRARRRRHADPADGRVRRPVRRVRAADDLALRGQAARHAWACRPPGHARATARLSSDGGCHETAACRSLRTGERRPESWSPRVTTGAEPEGPPPEPSKESSNVSSIIPARA